MGESHLRLRMMNKVLVVGCLVMLLMLSACNVINYEELDPDTPDDETISAEKLVIWWDKGIPHELFAAEALQQQFADTEFEFVQYEYPIPHIPHLANSEFGDLILTNMMKKTDQNPDLIVFDTRLLPLMIESGYLEPIPDVYAWESDPEVIREFRSLAQDLALYALPFGHIAEGMFYNKAIFHEMEVPYPEDGMTWDEVVELAKALKKDKENPIGIAAYDSVASQLSLRLYDPETQRFDFESEEWQEFTRILLELNDLEERHGEYGGFLMQSFSSGETAMVVGPLYGPRAIRPGLLTHESNLSFYNVDFDIVRFPVFDDEKRLQPASQMLAIGVPTRSMNQEDAYKVLRHLLSHEVQLDNHRKGIVSSRYDAAEYMDQFGELTLLAGKSIPSLFTDAYVGTRDPIFEYMHYMNMLLLDIVASDDEYRENIVLSVQQNLIQSIPSFLEERAQFIEDISSER